MVGLGCSIILALSAPPASAQDATTPAEDALEASLTQEIADGTSRVADPIEMNLTVTHPPGAEVFVPETTGNPRWEIVRVDRHPRADGESSTTTTLGLTLMVWRPGSTTLPPMEVQVTTTDGRQATLKTTAVTRKIISTLPTDKDPELASPRDPRAIYIHDYRPLWFGVGAGVIALTALFTFWFMRRRLAGIVPETPPIPIHVVAMERLSALATEDLEDRPTFVSFYISMSETIRVYLGKLHGFPGAELTTTEILERLQGVSWPRGLDAEDVQRWLEHCDRVKFTAHVPEVGRAEAALRTAFSLVELTRRHEEDLRTRALQEAPKTSEGLEAYREDKVQEDRWAAPALREEPVKDTPATQPQEEEDQAAREALSATALGGFSFEEVKTLTQGRSLDDEEDVSEAEATPETPDAQEESP